MNDALALLEPAAGGPVAVRQKIVKAEAYLLRQPQIEIPVTLLFDGDTCARQVTFPAGVAATGKVHRKTAMQIVMSGHMTIVSENGHRDVYGGDMFVSRPETKFFGVAHEDTVWVTVCTTTKRTLEEIEDELYYSPEEKPDFYAGGEE